MNVPNEVKTRRGNSSGSLRIRGLTYWVRWQYHGKTFDRSTGIRITEKRCHERALKAMDEMTAPYRLMNERDLQEFFSVRLKSISEQAVSFAVEDTGITIGEAYDAFVKSPRRRQVGPDTIKQYETILNGLAKKLGKDTPMRTVTKAIAEQYAIHLGESLANITFNNYIAKISHVWDVVGDSNGINGNPWQGIFYKKDDSLPREILTDDEIANVKKSGSAFYGGEARILIVIGVNTGMRIGDCRKLKWCDIDIENNFIRVKTQKTGKKVSIPLLKDLRDELSKFSAAQRKETYVLKQMANISKSMLSKAMQTVFKNAGIKTSTKVTTSGKKERPYKTFHSLRANFISFCAEMGIPLEIVREVVGHTTRKMTEHYMHIQEKAIKEAFEKAGVN